MTADETGASETGTDGTGTGGAGTDGTGTGGTSAYGTGSGGYGFAGLHHVQLAIPAGGEERCREFWGGVLGMAEVEKPAVLAARGGCWFRGGGLEVHLGVEADFGPARKAHPGILVRGLAELARRLEAGGHAVTWDGDFPGHDRFYAADPFGNRLEFLEPRGPQEPQGADRPRIRTPRMVRYRP